MINKKSSLSKVYASSYETRNKGGATNKGVMDWNSLDSEIEFFKPVEGRNRIRIVPYEIKTKNHPLVKNGLLEVGDIDYKMDIWEHGFVGASRSSILCNKKTYGLPCPICEQANQFKKEGKEKEAKELFPKRRVYYNVIDLKSPDKVKIFNTSHFLFEKELIDEARDDEDGGYIDFASIEDGKDIVFRASKTSLNGQEYLKFKSFNFKDSEIELTDELLSQAISFDEIMNVPTKDEAEKLLFGESDEEEQEEIEEAEEMPARPARVRAKADEEETEKVEETKVEKPTKSICDTCPFGHTFGADVDNTDDCDECSKWESCYNYNRKGAK